ncbi:MAG: Asp23/Gls24 family envelope stress response protein [Anaerolineales bacterium]
MRSPGKTTVAPDVLLAIARLTALKVDGVHSMGSAPRWNRDGKSDEGVLAHIDNERVDLDIYLVLNKDTNLRQVSREVQSQVARAIEESIGMDAGRINVHIDDVYFPALTTPAS